MLRADLLPDTRPCSGQEERAAERRERRGVSHEGEGDPLTQERHARLPLLLILSSILLAVPDNGNGISVTVCCEECIVRGDMSLYIPGNAVSPG